MLAQTSHSGTLLACTARSGATGKGHGSDTAVLLGLMGPRARHSGCGRYWPSLVAHVRAKRSTSNAGGRPHHCLQWQDTRDLTVHAPRDAALSPQRHAPGRHFDAEGGLLNFARRTYYSVGGGFIVSEEVADRRPPATKPLPPTPRFCPCPFAPAADSLLALCQHTRPGALRKSCMRNEQHWRSDARDATRGYWTGSGR
jgi:L-serine dehydratase